MTYILFRAKGGKPVIQEMTGVGIELREDGCCIYPPDGEPFPSVDFIKIANCLEDALEWLSDQDERP